MAYYHPQINSFGYGDITQITMDIETEQEPVYTKMYVVPGNVRLDENRLLYDFSIIILDRINEDYSNQRDVMSDTLEISKDIFTIIYQSYRPEYGDFSLFYTPEWGPSVTPFLEAYETILGGWTMNITLEQPFDYNICVLPIYSGFTLPVSTNLVNYKQVIEDLEDFANNHEQINSFGYGDLTQLTMDVITKQEPKYTRMYVIPGDTLLNQNELVYNFQIIVTDQLNNDYSNQRDVMSDTLEIMKDIMATFYLSEYESLWPAGVEPFLENYETILTGWVMNIQLSQPFDYNRCDLPERPFANRWSDLAELWKNVNKEWKNT